MQKGILLSQNPFECMILFDRKESRMKKTYQYVFVRQVLAVTKDVLTIIVLLLIIVVKLQVL